MATTTIEQRESRREGSSRSTSSQGSAGSDDPKGSSMPSLIIVGKKSEGEITLDGDDMTLGRAKAADVYIDDFQISRKHARITIDETGVFIHDLGSRNGIVVNKKRYIGRKEGLRLRNGDVITLGMTSLIFKNLADDGSDADVAPATKSKPKAKSKRAKAKKRSEESAKAKKVEADPLEETGGLDEDELEAREAPVTEPAREAADAPESDAGDAAGESTDAGAEADAGASVVDDEDGDDDDYVDEVDAKKDAKVGGPDTDLMKYAAAPDTPAAGTPSVEDDSDSEPERSEGAEGSPLSAVHAAPRKSSVEDEDDDDAATPVSGTSARLVAERRAAEQREAADKAEREAVDDDDEDEDDEDQDDAPPRRASARRRKGSGEHAARKRSARRAPGEKRGSGREVVEDDAPPPARRGRGSGSVATQGATIDTEVADLRRRVEKAEKRLAMTTGIAIALGAVALVLLFVTVVRGGRNKDGTDELAAADRADAEMSVAERLAAQNTEGTVAGALAKGEDATPTGRPTRVPAGDDGSDDASPLDRVPSGSLGGGSMGGGDSMGGGGDSMGGGDSSMGGGSMGGGSMGGDDSMGGSMGGGDSMGGDSMGMGSDSMGGGSMGGGGTPSPSPVSTPLDVVEPDDAGTSIAGSKALPKSVDPSDRLDRATLRELYVDLLGRTPTKEETDGALDRSKNALIEDLCGREEFYANWYEEELFFFLLIDNFRPATPRMKAIPKRMADGKLTMASAIREIVISQYFNQRNPGNDTYVTVVLEQLLGITVQENRKTVRTLEAGKKMYDGYEAKIFGKEGSSQSDFVKIVMKEDGFTGLALQRFHRRVVGEPIPDDILARDTERLVKEPKAMADIVKGWVSSEHYGDRIALLRPKSERVYIRGLYVDLLGRTPSYDEFRNMRNALQALTDDAPIKAVLARLLVSSRYSRLPYGQANAEYVTMCYRRFLARDPGKAELDAFVSVMNEPGCSPQMAALAILTHGEYRYY